MNVAIKIDAAALLAAFEKLPDQTARELRTAMSIACRNIRVDAAQKPGTKTAKNIGKSIQQEVSESGLHGTVYLDTGIVPYAEYVHEGTKPRTQPTYPKTRKALHWVKGGKDVFAKSVRHPGSKPHPFLYKAFSRKKAEVKRLMDEAVGRAISKAGL